jgi:hypothetical protein
MRGTKGVSKFFFYDEENNRWVWEIEKGWLDIVYPSNEQREDGSGYPVKSVHDVVEIMHMGGYIDEELGYDNV